MVPSELLQNADDAGARSVQIRFCSKDGAQREDRKAVTPSNQDGETEGPGERGMKKQGAVPDFAKQEVRRNGGRVERAKGEEGW